jgi:DNA-binding transcriptional MerR regulator
MTDIQIQSDIRIGALAAGAGVSVQAVRYYERRGLVLPIRRTTASYRMYAPDSVHVVRFIKRAQQLGFSLDEVADLLRLRKGAPGSRRQARTLAAAKVADVEVRLRDLTAVRDGLRGLIAACGSRANKLSAAQACPILDALDAGLREERVPGRRSSR